MDVFVDLRRLDQYEGRYRRCYIRQQTGRMRGGVEACNNDVLLKPAQYPYWSTCGTEWWKLRASLWLCVQPVSCQYSEAHTWEFLVKFRVIVKSLILEKGRAGIPVRGVYLKPDLLYAPLETKSVILSKKGVKQANQLKTAHVSRLTVVRPFISTSHWWSDPKDCTRANNVSLYMS